jgi:hypothetical protein
MAIVATVNFLRSKTLSSPYNFADKFDEPISLPLVQGDKEHLMGLINALKDNSSVKKLIFSPYIWKPDEVRVLADSLSENRGVTEIQFQSFGFVLEFVEYFVRILKRNKSIKSILFARSRFPLDAWTRFCDGLEYYSISRLYVEGLKVTEQQMATFCEGIKFNQTITSLSFTEEPFPGKSFNILCTMLASNPTIGTLELRQCGNNNERMDHQAMNQIFKANYLKILRLFSCGLFGSNLKLISTELQNNTSITELSLAADAINVAEVGIILQNNKTIKKLDLSYIEVLKEHNIRDLGLGYNKTLTDLSVAHSYNLSLAILFEELSHNTTLKILRIGNNAISSPEPIGDYLSKTTTLRELYIENPYTGNIDVYAIGLTSALKVNKSLRKVEAAFVNVNWEILEELLQSLQRNQSLTYLDIDLQRKNPGLIGQPYTQEAENCIWELLKTNKTLRHLVGAEKMVGFKKNREEQDKVIMNTCLWVKMILMKPSSFVLPIEVWSNIFKYASYTFAPFDFEEFFKNAKSE